MPSAQRLLGLAAITSALGSALMHLSMIADLAPLAAATTTTMAVICIGCATHVFHHPNPRRWAVTATMAATMLGVHLLVMGSPPGHSMADHAAPMPSIASMSSTNMSVILVFTLVELATAIAGLSISVFAVLPVERSGDDIDQSTSFR